MLARMAGGEAAAATVRPGPGVCWAELRGRDYPLLGPLACAALGAGGAVALSRGAYPKPYDHVDPNEDGALVYRNRDGALLCVVDGHNGARASEVALDQALARAEDLIAADGRAFVECVEEIVRGAAQVLRREKRSRTCLLLASMRGDRCHWAGLGDSGLFRASRMGAENPENDFYLGATVPDELPAELWSGSFSREPGERIAVVSDGVTNFIRELSRLQAILTDAPDDAEAARMIAHAAMNGGAGDNVAVATLGA